MTKPTMQDNTHTRLHTIIEAPIFIVGSPRSGTTWLQRLLLSHPEICGGQETHFFSTLGSSVTRPYKVQQASVRKIGLPCYWSEADIKARLFGFWFDTVKGIVEKSPNAKYLLEKTPDHARHMDTILEILPKARFIHLIRDSRSVASSLLAANKEEWGKQWAPKSAKDAAIVWYLNVLEAREFGKTLPNTQYYELRYEDLKADAFQQLKQVFEYLAIPVSENDLKTIVQGQDFETQRKLGGSPLPATTDSNSGAQKEPEGFFRKGALDSWKSDLNFLEKLTVWRYTRKLMKASGYRDLDII